MKKLTWFALNTKLRSLTTEQEVLRLLEAERNGAARWRWVSRIYSRYARLRRQREKREMVRK